MDRKIIPDSADDKKANPLMQPHQDSEAFHGNDKEIFIRKAFDENPAKGCELLFKLYYQPLCSHAVRMVYSKQIAQDLVSDIFYSFWQNQLHLRITTSFRAYLFTAIRNRSLKYIRSEFGKFNTADISEIELISDMPTPQHVMQYSELHLELEKTIQSLSPQCQKVFLMSRFEGKKNQEIAGELKLSIKTIEAHIGKALDRLRKIVRQDD